MINGQSVSCLPQHWRYWSLLLGIHSPFYVSLRLEREHQALSSSDSR